VQELPEIAGAFEKIRAVPAGPEDALALQALMDAARDYFVLTEGEPAAGDAARDLLAEAEADEARRVYLLRSAGAAAGARGASGNAAVGFLDLHLHQPEPGVAHVGVLALRPDARGRGLGGALVEALAGALAAAGFTALRCSVGDENPGARSFWERAGFGAVGRIEGGVTVLERALPAAD
jgi:ribosomal protein S18 acetylase RimI-like enzyme